ncbi:MAG: hypothetical protein CL581_10030 [Alteromonadaceae bacterium]|nr:hypothetical protein [Alteromonadaceae bacterium]MBH84962.1 hypothetical protein [Alteromonadaceae bacterium]|tara:strand:+ start:470 stop:754 length:285 start_codon:yes stop_codon:yes gene_type:complete
MAAYLIGQIKVNDSERWGQYVEGVALSLKPFAASIVMRGEKHGMLAGENPKDRVVVVEFDTMETLESWFHSDAYQALIPLRDSAADVIITTYTA